MLVYMYGALLVSKVEGGAGEERSGGEGKREGEVEPEKGAGEVGKRTKESVEGGFVVEETRVFLDVG